MSQGFDTPCSSRLICREPAYLAVLKDWILPFAAVTSAIMKGLPQPRSSEKEESMDSFCPSQFWAVRCRQGFGFTSKQSGLS